MRIDEFAASGDGKLDIKDRLRFATIGFDPYAGSTAAIYMYVENAYDVRMADKLVQLAVTVKPSDEAVYRVTAEDRIP